jgi:hypothetical protein
MRRLWSAALLLVVAILPAVVAAPGTGPFTGTITQSATNSHAYSSYPPAGNCLAVYMPRTYSIRIEHAPVDDSLTISARGFAATTHNGGTTLSFVANYCTAFTITVAGTTVATEATYAITVTSTPVINVIA